MKRFQFNLRTLLIILMLVALYFAGRRSGYKCGYVAAEKDYGVGGPALNNAYPVSDLVIPLDAEKRSLAD